MASQRYVTALVVYTPPSDTVLSQEEYSLLLELAPLNTPAALAQTFSTLTSPLSMLFTSTLGALGSLIKRNLNKHTFLALSAYSIASQR